MRNIKLIVLMCMAGAMMTGCGTKNNTTATDSPTATVPVVDNLDGNNNNNGMTGDNAVKDAVDGAGNAAGDIVDGAGEVVEDAGNAVGDAAKDVGNAAKDATN